MEEKNEIYQKIVERLNAMASRAVRVLNEEESKKYIGKPVWSGFKK